MGISTHTYTQAQKERYRKEQKEFICCSRQKSTSSVLTPFCPGKHSKKVKIHLLEISKKSEPHQNQSRNAPNEGKLHPLARNTGLVEYCPFIKATSSAAHTATTGDRCSPSLS